MFFSPATADLTSQPRKGFGARVASGFTRIGAALRHAVAAGLRRPAADPDSRTAPDASRTAAADANPPDAATARTPRPPHCPGTGMLARVTGRRQTATAAQRRSQELADAAFIDASFPGLHPDVREFFNTPVGECDPEMLRGVLGALAEVIARAMPPQEGMRDTQDVFLALSNRLGMVLGEAAETPPAAMPEAAAAADTGGAAVLDPPAGSAGVPDAALPGDLAVAAAGATPVARGAAVPATAEADQSAAAPVAAEPIVASQVAADPIVATPVAVDQPAAALVASWASGTSAGDSSLANEIVATRGRAQPCHARRGLLHTRPRFALRRHTIQYRNIIPLRRRCQLGPLPRPPRLLFYAACAGPPARVLRRAASGASCRKICTGPSYGGPAIPIRPSPARFAVPSAGKAASKQEFQRRSAADARKTRGCSVPP